MPGSDHVSAEVRGTYEHHQMIQFARTKKNQSSGLNLKIGTLSIIALFALSVVIFSYARVNIFSPGRVSVLTQSEDQDRDMDKQDIREAVFRYQFNHNASGQQQNAKVYFLSLDQDKDPSNEFMERFKGTEPPVKKASQASKSAGGVVDKETGERGLLFRITSIKRLGENEVEVEGGYFEAGQSASRNVYRVKHENGKWVVKEEKLKRIS
jgi:hypothetical protein